MKKLDESQFSIKSSFRPIVTWLSTIDQ